MRFKTLAIVCLVCTSVLAEQLAIGSWRTHLAYSNTLIIAQTENEVYGVSGGALYSVNKDDLGIELLSKITGLNDNNIAYIAYSEQEKTLIIAYANANIDLLTADGIYNVTDLYRKNMAGSKNINHIYCRGKYAYLSCDFGIVVLDIPRQEIADTYIIGTLGDNVPVLSFFEYNDTFYATTADAIKQAPASGKNLANFENWSTIETPHTKSNKQAVAYNGNLYVLQSDSVVYKQSNGAWNKVYSPIANIGTDSANLYLMEQHSFTVISPSGKRTYNNSGIAMTQYDAENDCFWAAANSAGIAKIGRSDNSTNIFCPNGPAVNYAWRIRYSDGKIFVVPGGRWAVQYQRPGHVMMFENNTWTNIYEGEITAHINSTQSFPITLPTIDFVDIAIDPADKTHFFVASYGMGLYEFRNNKPYKLHNADNSGVESIFPEQKPTSTYYMYHRTDGVTYDSNGNLYFLNMGPYGITSTIKYISPDGITHNVPYNTIQKVETAQDIIISGNDKNLKWVLIPRFSGNNNTGLFVYYDNGTPDKTSDDLSRLFTSFYDQDGNHYAPQNFRCIAQDKDHRLWIGTNDGICVLNNQTQAFEDNYTCSRIKIPRNDGTNLADYLLDGIQINAIAVDGSNRKWIGTESNGVFLMSEDGLETIEHFTSENSPLLSNNIICIGINDKTGEVFFGTGNGLCSYQSDASEGNDTFNNVHAFPNPVREDYSGVITITGLVTDTRVKITDIAGNVVYETMSNGGIATWDGNRRDGGRVATGVDLVMCFSADGTQHETTKILIINK